MAPPSLTSPRNVSRDGIPSSPHLRAAGRNSVGLVATNAEQALSSSPTKRRGTRLMTSVGLVAAAGDKQMLNSSPILTKRRATSLMSSHRPWHCQGWRTPSSPPSRRTPSSPPSRIQSRAVTRGSAGTEDSSPEFHELLWPTDSNNESKKPGSQPMPRNGHRTSSACINNDVERCDCCSKEDFWSIFDVFEAMDRRGCGTICRADFVWALAALGASSEYQRIVRRTKLSAHFRATVQELSLEDFIHLAFLGVSAQDVARMQRWATLRRARNALVNHYSKLDEIDLQKIFAALTEDDDGKFIYGDELLRSAIITHPEALAFMPGELGSTRLNFKGFNQLMHSVFSARCAISEALESPKYPRPPGTPAPTKTRPQVYHGRRGSVFNTDQLAAVAAF